MKIILLGHGEETKQGFSFKNIIINQRITLHSVTKANMWLSFGQAIMDIIRIIKGESLDYRTYDNNSTIGGHEIADRILAPLTDEQRNYFECECSLNKVDEYKIKDNDGWVSFNSYKNSDILLLSPQKEVLLSTILEAINKTYPLEKVDVYWMACR